MNNKYYPQGEYLIQTKIGFAGKPDMEKTRYLMSSELKAWITKNQKDGYEEGVDFKIDEDFNTAEVPKSIIDDDWIRFRKDKPEDNPPTLVEKFADNGEHSHWELINTDTGEKLWEESPAPVVEDRPKWEKKEQEPKTHNNYPIRYKIDGEWIYTQCFWNKSFGWQGYEIFDFEWLSEGQNT